jgi:hypothetical protein
VSFFEAPPPPPEPPPQPPRRPWRQPSDAVVGRTVALNLIVGRSDNAALWIPSTAVYPEGFEFEVEIRLDEGEIEHPFFMHHPRRRRQQQAGELDPDLVRFGIEFSDGRKATNLGGHMPFAMPDEPDAPPPEPLLAPSRGGGGGGGRWHHGFWVWPLPPDGPLVFVCEWPVAGIGETRTEIDSALIRDAAAEVVELWPEESGSGPVGHGRSQTALMRAGSAAQVALPELTVETERRTQLVDITDQVRELVQRRQGAGAAVVVFVPHTTAGLLLQASGPGAATVARDMETLLERLVDESWEWRNTPRRATGTRGRTPAPPSPRRQ